jgi:hypothetical protein
MLLVTVFFFALTAPCWLIPSTLARSAAGIALFAAFVYVLMLAVPEGQRSRDLRPLFRRGWRE